jgi:hypothetical protein
VAATTVIMIAMLVLGFLLGLVVAHLGGLTPSPGSRDL